MKGTAVQSSLRFVKERFGEAALARIVGALPPTDRPVLEMERILELAGAKRVRSAHSSCVHRGDRVCRFEGSWD